MNRVSKKVKNWNRNSLKRLTYMVTDKGPLEGWLHNIGRAEDDKCTYSERQNPAHILQCRHIGDGKGRTRGEAEEDEEWCGAVYETLRKQVE